MIRWSNHATRPLPLVSNLNELFNSDNSSARIPTGSVKTYFARNTYNKLRINSTFTGWIRVSMTEAQVCNSCAIRRIVYNMMHSARNLTYPLIECTYPQAAAGNSGLGCCNLHAALREALSRVDAAIDFRRFDANGDGIADLVTVCSAVCCWLASEHIPKANDQV
jgi:hypothetical protein